MSGLVEAITVEISDREQRRTSLTSEIDQIDRQLEQLYGMHQAATVLAGEGTVEEPKPAGPSRISAKPGGRSLSPGRNGGKAPGGRRAPAVTGKRQPGSAPSGKPAPARTPSSANGEGGGSKRAAVLAFVRAAQAPVKRGEIAAALDMTGSAVGQHLVALVGDGALQARGATAKRVYFTTGQADKTEEPAVAPAAPAAAAAAAAPTLIGGGSVPADDKERVLAALRTANAAWRTSEVAYQASKGGAPIAKRDAERALFALLATGHVARFAGHGGIATWRAAE